MVRGQDSGIMRPPSVALSEPPCLGRPDADVADRCSLVGLAPQTRSFRAGSRRTPDSQVRSRSPALQG
jgi:hypothetical protein